MRDLDRFLGDGGMPLLAELGVSFTGYAPNESTATWTVRATCLNPAGIVQAGVHAVVLDAAMYFALVASLESGEYGSTLEMSTQTLEPARGEDQLTVQGQVTRVARTVAFCWAEVRRGEQRISTAHATFAVRRREPS